MNNATYLLILFCASIIFLIIISRKKSNKGELLSFISTMIATLIGVLIAVNLSNIENEKRERVDTIKLLKSAIRVLETTFGYTEGLEKYMLEIEKDSIKYSDAKILTIKKDNPIPYPNLMETIMANEIISKNVTEFSHNLIYIRLISLPRLNNYDTIETYKRVLKELLLLFDLEIEFQKGNINLENTSNKFNTELQNLIKKYPSSESIKER